LKRLHRIALLLSMAASLGLLAASAPASEMTVILSPGAVHVVAHAQLQFQFAPSGSGKVGAKIESASGILAYGFCDDEWNADKVATAAQAVARHLQDDPVVDLPRLLEAVGFSNCRDHA
jgi:hypothetical protein